MDLRFQYLLPQAIGRRKQLPIGEQPKLLASACDSCRGYLGRFGIAEPPARSVLPLVLKPLNNPVKESPAYYRNGKSFHLHTCLLTIT